MSAMKPQEDADSYYRASCRYRIDARPLRGARRADVAVIGGGITGVSAALHLAERGAEVAVLEARDFGWGASGRSGGQILAGFSIDQRKLEKLVGEARARELWEHSLAALDLTRRRIAEARIECDLAENYVHAAVRESQARDLREWAEHLGAHYGYELQYLEREQLREIVASELYSGGVFDRRSGHLHPLNYCLGLAQAAQRAGASLHNASAVREVRESSSETTLRTDGGSLRCGQVIYACNAYLGNLQPRLEKMIMPVGTYIIATEPLAPARADALIANRAAVADTNLVLDYYRLSADHRMLFGGRVNYSGWAPRNLERPLRRRMLRVFPQLAGARVDFAWGGKVAITRNRAPHIGSFGARNWFAHGFSGQGMSLSGYAGGLLADAVMGETARLECFRAIPHRAFPGGRALRAPALVAEMAWRRLADRFA